MDVLVEGSDLEIGPPEMLTMAGAPVIGDRLYNVLGRACVIVYKRDWYLEAVTGVWYLKVWVR